MMLTILGLPQSIKYQDLKALIKKECNVSEFILDNLVSHTNGTKKVRLGLSDDRDGTQIMKCLNGYRMAGNLLMVEPVGKVGSGSVFAPQNEYSNQGRPLPWGPSNPNWGQGSAASQIQPDYNYQNQGQVSHSPYMQQQSAVHQRGESFGQQPGYGQDRMHQPNQGYGYQSKPSYPEPNITIMKDNFKGPASFPDQHPPRYQGQSHDEITPWSQQNPQGYNDRKFPQGDKRPPIMKSAEDVRNIRDNFKPTREFSPPRGPGAPSRRMSPPGRRLISPGRRLISPGRRLISPGRRLISPERKMSPPGRRMSPSGRRMSPRGRRMSPSGRRLSPPGRKVSPLGRRMSPSGRRPSPSTRRVSPSGDRRLTRHSPGRRISPNKRVSPGRLDSPSRRYSPSRRLPEKPVEKYVPGDSRSSNFKQVRPAYEPTPQASKQDMYSGGYRSNVHENAQYPTPGFRQPDQRISPWQQERDKAAFAEAMKKREAERREVPRMQNFDTSRGSDKRMVDQKIEAKRPHSPNRKSRSPIRRERSPVKARYRRHSPSPRSPRRSWALEKRRSPDNAEPPPPPLWPGQREENKPFPKPNRQNYSDRPNINEKKPMSVWESTPFKDDAIPERHDDRRHEGPSKRFNDQIRVREDLITNPTTSHPGHRQPSPHGRGYKPQDERFAPPVQREVPKFSPRDDFARDNRTDDLRRQENMNDRKQYFGESGGPGLQRSYARNFPHRREEIQRRVEEKKEEFQVVSENFNKEIEDIRRRAMEFHKKAEERRRSDGEDRNRQNEIDRQRYPQREEVIRNQSYRDDTPRSNFRHPETDRRLHDPEHRYLESDRQKHETERHRHLNSEHHLEGKRHMRQEDLYSPSDQFKQNRNREVEWKSNENERPNRYLRPTVKAKRDKAVDDLAAKIIRRQNAPYTGDILRRLNDELKLLLSRIINDMFGDKDTSFIEIVIKFSAKYTDKDEDRIYEEALSNFRYQMRNLKRPAPEASEIPAKRRSPLPHMNQDLTPKEVPLPQQFNLNMPSTNLPIQQFDPVTQMPLVVQQPYIVQMQQYMPTFEEQTQTQIYNAPNIPMFQMQQHEHHQEESPKEEGYNLYLCKDDFEPYTSIQIDYLKQFLVAQIFQATAESYGWTPDFTLKGLQSLYRYEVTTNDEKSRDWLINFDFHEFSFFNVLVYTKEELWYERAAVWLPDHSRFKNLEPLEKLKLQNKKLEGVNIGKWKLVKKIVTEKGTRVYVDMPPSSARALEKHKMLLSYELQKVSVFLKAVAVDKDAFDAGLKFESLKDQSMIIAAAKSSPIPSLNKDPKNVLITLKGNKTLSIFQARKIKEMIIYHIFKYHQQPDTSRRTDFVKYGYCTPGYFGILPENNDSKKWLMNLDIGKLNRQAVIVLGSDKDTSAPYVTIIISVPKEGGLIVNIVQERLKKSNRGLEGIKFDIWKPIRLYESKGRTLLNYEVSVDLDSVETMSKLKYQLDYVDGRFRTHTVDVKSEFSRSKLEQMIKKYKAESKDSYDVANMEISDDEGAKNMDIATSDEEVVFLD